MRKPIRLLTLAAIALSAAAIHGQIPAPPPWAYGFVAVGDQPAPPPCTPTSKPLDCARLGAPRPKDVIHTLPDTTRKFTEFDIHYDWGPADWYPEDHPPMPEIVARGRESDKLRPCGLCHYPNGQGKPENAPVARTPSTFNELNSTGVPRSLMPTTSPFSNSPATPGSRTMRLPMLPSATLPNASVETTFITLGAKRCRVIEAASPSRELETVTASRVWMPPEVSATVASVV